ncbi:MAG: M20/M25/M40 family metallo-hydrolase [Anaerolineaceae bacterium]|nr:MAG: M20/M25/M40 family metallo-hydrolase [Anaerolineaceae bacterium]
MLVWLVLLVTACGLNDSAPPPIIEPRPASTPTATAAAAPREAVRADVALLRLLDQVQEDRLMAHIAALEGMTTRHVNAAQEIGGYGIGAAADYIYEQFERIAATRAGFSVSQQDFTLTFNGITTPQRNIIGVLGGTSADAGVVIVGAHYDSRSWDRRDAEGYAPGANDNASGVAAVIEMARIISQQPRRATVIFVLFSGGQTGGREGSRAFVDEYLRGFDVDDVMMLNVNRVGNWNNAAGEINARDLHLYAAPPVDSPSRRLARNLDFMAYHHQLALNIIPQTTIDPEGGFGDHLSFDEAGYTAVRFTSALEDADAVHGADTIDRVESAYLAAATRTILGVLHALTAGPSPPRNITFRADGATASALWEPVAGASGYVVAMRRHNSLIYERYFVVDANRTAAWDGWRDFDLFAVATIDSAGLVGRFSAEIAISR